MLFIRNMKPKIGHAISLHSHQTWNFNTSEFFHAILPMHNHSILSCTLNLIRFQIQILLIGTIYRHISLSHTIMIWSHQNVVQFYFCWFSYWNVLNITVFIYSQGRSQPFFPFTPKLYSVSRISNFAKNNNNNSQLNFCAQNYFKGLLC